MIMRMLPTPNPDTFVQQVSTRLRHGWTIIGLRVMQQVWMPLLRTPLTSGA